jgi:hypothetical protein
MAPFRFPVQGAEPSRAKLWDPQHRDAGYHSRPGGVEALPGVLDTPWRSGLTTRTWRPSEWPRS